MCIDTTSIIILTPDNIHFSVCPEIIYTPINSNQIKQNIDIKMGLKQYGFWNGTHIIHMDSQELVFPNLSTVSFEINLEKYRSRNNSTFPSLYELDSEKHDIHENEIYAAKIIWKLNHKKFAKEEQLSSLELKCKDDKFLNTGKWMCKNAEIIEFSRVCDGYSNTSKDCSDASDESALVCSVEVPYDAIGVIVSYIVIGMIAFMIYSILLQ